MQLAGQATPHARLPTIDEILSRSRVPAKKSTFDFSTSIDHPIWQTTCSQSSPPGRRVHPNHKSLPVTPSSTYKARRHSVMERTNVAPDGESIIELAKFLRTRSPPPGNYMSLPDTRWPSVHSRRMPLKIFRRHSHKKSSGTGPKPLRLPDSAVAVRTSQGHWHIAISIPAEYDHSNPHADLPNQPVARNRSQSTSVMQDGPITVLKPVMPNVRPGSLDGATRGFDPNSTNRASRTKPKLSPPIPKAAEAMKAWPPPEQSPERTVVVRKVEKTRNPVSNKPQSIHKSASAHSLSRQHSQESDTRQSVATAFSARSLETKTGHSRRQSSVSTAPSLKYPVSPKGPESPVKLNTSPSLPSVAEPLEATGSLFSSANGVNSQASSEIGDVARQSKTDSVISSAYSAIENVAETAKAYGPSDVASAQVMTTSRAPRMPGPAPTRKLPDLPEGSNSRRSISSPSGGVSMVRSAEKPSNQWPIFRSTLRNDSSSDHGSEYLAETISLSSQTRRDRVKAIRSRDMAQLRATSKYLQVMASVAAQGSGDRPTPLPDTGACTKMPPRQIKRRSLSYPPVLNQASRQNTAIKMTPVMLVADLKPPFSQVSPGDLITPQTPRRVPETKGTVRRKGKAAKKRKLPGTITPSLASSDEEYFQAPRCRSSPTSTSRSTSGGLSGNHRVSAVRRKKSTQEAVLDSRLRKLEESSAVMLQTLNTVIEMGVGFRELQKLWLADSTHSSDFDLRESLTGQIGRGLASIEPLMRELTNATKSRSDNFGAEEEDQEYES